MNFRTIRAITTAFRHALNTYGYVGQDRLGDLVATIRDDLDGGLLSGVAGYAELELATNPTHLDRFTIGGTTIQFINSATGTVIGNDAYVAVLRGANAAASLANAIAAINGAAAQAHATVTLADTTTPAIGNSAEKVRAFASGTKLVIVPALTAGNVNEPAGTSIASITLSDNLTAAVAWNVSNLGTLGLDAYVNRSRTITFAVTAAMIASGRAQFDAGFAVRALTVQIFTSAGKIKAPVDDTYTFSGQVVTVTLTGGGTDLVATNVVVITAHG